MIREFLEVILSPFGILLSVLAIILIVAVWQMNKVSEKESLEKEEIIDGILDIKEILHDNLPTLKEYKTDYLSKEFYTEVGLINKIIIEATNNGGDAGGSYNSCPDYLKKAIQKWMEFRCVPKNDYTIMDINGYYQIVMQYYPEEEEE